MSLEHKMIEPFTDRQVREGVISYGVSSYGYDIRVADEFRIFYQRQFHHRRSQKNLTLARWWNSRRRVHRSAKLLLPWRAPWSIPHSAQRADHLRR